MNIGIARFFFQISHPLYLLCNFLVYALGVGIAKYLGAPLDWSTYILGQLWSITLQLGGHYLTAYFLIPGTPKRPDQILLPKADEKESSQFLRRDTILWGAFAALAGTTSITLMLIRSDVSVAALIVMGLMTLGVFVYSIPPFQLARSGYGEITLALLMANMVPAFAFLLQGEELHRLVAMSTFPLTILHFAMLLALQLPGYFQDVKSQKGTFLVNLGWQRGMVAHNLLVLSAYLLLGVAILAGVPSAIGLPVFFVLPLALFQVWYMTRIASGAKPYWRILNWTSILTFGLTAYLLVFGFWTH